MQKCSATVALNFTESKPLAGAVNINSAGNAFAGSEVWVGPAEIGGPLTMCLVENRLL